MFMKKAMMTALGTALALGTVLPIHALASDAEGLRYFSQIELDHNMISLAPGQHVLLSAESKVPVGMDGAIAWSSSNPSVARVTSEGRVYALKTGDTVISASVGTLSVDCRVEVSVDPIPYDGPVTSAVRRGYTSAAEDKASVSLKDWEGEWNTVTTYFDHEDVMSAFAALEDAGEMEDGAFLAGFGDMFKTDFLSLSVDGNKVSFFDAVLSAEDAENEAVAEASYAFLETSEGAEGTATIFETQDEDAAYKYLMLFAPELDETGESINHFHFLYGNDLEALKAEESWVPMMVQVDTTDAQIVNGFSAFAAGEAE